MTTGFTALAIIFMLAFFNESTIEWLFGEWQDKRIIKYLALAGGLALAMVFQVQMLKSLAGNLPGISVNPWADMVLSGLVMARGSQFVHDFYSRFLKPPA